MDYLSFAVLMLLGQFSPGPDMLLLLKNAVNHPLRIGLWTVAGIATGLAAHTTLALTGLAVIFHQSAPAGRLLSLAGGLYLGWLALQLLRSVFHRPLVTHDSTTSANPVHLTSRGAYTQGLVTNLLNPKAAVFLLSVLAASLEHDHSLHRKLIFAAIIVGQALLFWSLFVWLLQRPAVRRLYQDSQRCLNLLFGLALASLAVAAILSAANPAPAKIPNP